MYASSSRTPQSASTLPPHHNPRKHPAPKQTSIGYPILSPSELLDCLLELGAHLAPEDLVKPTASTIRNAWGAVLHYFTGVSIAGLERPKSAVLSMCSYPELYSDALLTQMLFIHVKRLVKTAGVETFTLQDLTRPEAARVRDCFSAVINFAKFKLSHSGLYEELVARGDEINERRAQLADEAVRISAQVQQLKDRQEADVPRIEEAKARNEAIFGELGELKKQQKKLTDSYLEVEKEREGLRKTYHALQESTNALTSEINTTRSRLMRSPDRIRRTIGELATNTAREKERHQSMQKTLRELDARIELMRRCFAGVEAQKVKLKQAEDLSNELDDKRSKRADVDAKSRALEIDRQTSVARYEQLATQLANASEKLTRARESWAEKKERFRISIARLREDYAVILRERDEDETLLRETEQEIARLTQESEKFVKDNQDDVDQLMGEYWRLRAQCEQYMAEMKSRLAFD